MQAAMPRAFVLMPFAPEFDEIYNLFIATTLSEAGYDVFRADDILSQQNILQDIVLSIASSQLIVADLTGSNPNVYYELGLAHALQKPVVLLTQSVTELPFDLRSYRVVSYNTHFAAIQKARNELLGLARGARDGSVPFGSPIKDFLSRPSEEQVARSSPTSSTDDEFGFLDHMVEMEEGFERLSLILGEVSNWTEQIGKETERVTEGVTSAKANGGSGTARQIQKLARRLAEKQHEYAANLSQANDEYSGILSRVESSLEYIVSNQSATTEEERVQLAEFLEVLGTVEESALNGRAGFVGMASSMDELPKMERHLSRATSQASNQVKRLIENIDHTIAMVSRARGIGERVLRYSGPSDGA